MEETFKNWAEYALRAWQGTEWGSIVVAGFMFLLICLVAHYRSNRYQEQMVSKRSMKARNKAEDEKIEQTITEALEAKFKAGEIRREAVDNAYVELKRNTKFRSVGTEPTYGAPWYEPVKSKAADVKKGIFRRLQNAGVNVKAAIQAMRQHKEAPPKIKTGLKSLKKHSIPTA